MSNLALVTDNMLPVANETFIDNLSAGISAGAAIVPINSLAEYADGDSVVLTVDPGTASQATFIGEKQGNTVIDCKWTEGNVGASHAAGATVIDYDSATHYNVVTKLLRMIATETGGLKTTAVQAALNISSAVPADWTPLANVPSVTASNGQKEQVLTYTGVDYSDRIQKGTKLRIPRTVAPSTQCADFESSLNQYASKITPTGVNQTDDITVEAWVKLESYGNGGILSRYNGSSGFRFLVNTDGTFDIVGYNGGATNHKQVISNQSIPLGRWVHIAATLDMSSFTSATNKMFIDGVDIPCNLNTNGTNPTAFVAAGDLALSNWNANYFDGMMSEVRYWSTIRTPAQIRDNATKALAGNEAGLAGYWKLNGNFNDSTANANHMTTSGGVLATTVDNPFKAVEYAFATKVAYTGGNTVVTVFTGSNMIPSEVLAATAYSTARTPFGFPAEKNKWQVVTCVSSIQATSIVALNIWYPSKIKITVPTGDWELGYQFPFQIGGSTAATISGASILANYVPTNGVYQNELSAFIQLTGSANNLCAPANESVMKSLAAADTFTVYGQASAVSGSSTWWIRGDVAICYLTADCAYL